MVVCLGLTTVARAQSTSPARSSITDSISSGMGRIGDAITPKTPVKPADDAVSLQSKGKPTIETYVAMARFYEETNRYPEAESQYKRALQDSPNDLRAMLGYARLKDRMGEPQEALKLYQRAAKAHPKEPSVLNNLAVHYAREGMLRESVGSLEQAIQLRPRDPKYRNNLATLLVELGRPQEAFTQLRAVHDEAAAHYNLGYLLNRKGQTQAAAQEFAVALRLNPSLAQARQWLDRINGRAAPGPQPGPEVARAAQRPPIGRQEPGGEPQLGQPVAIRPPQQAGPPVTEYPALGSDRRGVEESHQAARPSYDAPARDGTYVRPDNAIRPSGVRQLPPPPAGLRQQDVQPEESRLPQRLPPAEEASGPELMAPMPPGR
jgi:Tfp pilus assembly protein PilF